LNFHEIADPRLIGGDIINEDTARLILNKKPAVPILFGHGDYGADVDRDFEGGAVSGEGEDLRGFGEFFGRSGCFGSRSTPQRRDERGEEAEQKTRMGDGGWRMVKLQL